MTETTFPYRLADSSGEGWLHTGDGLYSTFPRTDLGDMEYDQLVSERGPLREIAPESAEDSQAIQEALTAAGKKAVITLLAALYATARKVMDQSGGRIAVMTAGRPGSWEADRLRNLIWEGDGVKPSRVDQAALDTLTGIFERWVLTGDTVVEMAENLAGDVAQVAGKIGGWNAITDQWVRSAQYAESLGTWLVGADYHS
ncbi:hypothetical protein [Kitasatospora viridis]|uniref:Uncharacterized protein n=1 Tax=Kitasatospora viridis TaxID=281105 RepID=A0A561SAB5_9ACTN|nr:hypothetical protein [Kitasatospora viridis]TWF71745.1 hypothetical protein FHX73_18116 [Kitasatospora viridis]